MKLWVDDLRPAPPGYVWIKSVDMAKTLIQGHNHPTIDDTIWFIDELNLDHDAGDYANYGGDYIEILKWMEKEGINDIPIHLHTMNPVGRENMRAIIQHNGWKEV